MANCILMNAILIIFFYKYCIDNTNFFIMANCLLSVINGTFITKNTSSFIQNNTSILKNKHITKINLSSIEIDKSNINAFITLNRTKLTNNKTSLIRNGTTVFLNCFNRKFTTFSTSKWTTTEIPTTSKISTTSEFSTNSKISTTKLTTTSKNINYITLIFTIIKTPVKTLTPVFTTKATTKEPITTTRITSKKFSIPLNSLILTQTPTTIKNSTKFYTTSFTQHKMNYSLNPNGNFSLETTTKIFDYEYNELNESKISQKRFYKF